MADVVPLRADKEVRQLPFNIEAEQALLGALLLNNDVLRVVADILEPEHFYDGRHRLIYDVAAKLVRADKPATPVTMKTFLGDANIEGVPVTQYLARLVAEATTVINARGYAETIRDLHARRQIISLCKTIEEVSYDAQPDMPITQLVERFEQGIAEVTPAQRRGASENFTPFSQAITETVDYASEAYKFGGQRIVGVSTGFTELDFVLGGMQGGDLVVIGGRPGSGKTALGTNIGYNIAYQSWHAHEKCVVGFASYEMKRRQIGERVMSDQSNLAGWRVRTGKFNESDFVHYTEVAKILQDLPLFILDAGSLTIDALKLKAKALNKKIRLKALVVDYIQLMQGRRLATANRNEEISSITGGLKNLAKDLDIPVIAISQLSRLVEMRDDKRPILSDLRDSGTIEQDADVVILLYREEYYLRQRQPAHGTDEHLEWQAKMERWHGKAELIIPKVRHGAAGKIEMSFDGEHARFGAPNIDDQLPLAPGAKEARKREKKEARRALTGNSLILYQILRGMSLSRGVAPEPNMREVSPNARIVPVEDVRKKFYQDTDPTADDKKNATAFKNAFAALRAAELAFYVEGEPDTWWLWMPEMATQRKGGSDD